MASANLAERILSYFTTPEGLPREEVQRRNVAVRRLAWAQLVGAAVLVGTQIIAGTLGHWAALTGIGITFASALVALWLTTLRRPVEAAWVQVLAVSAVASLLAAAEVVIAGTPPRPTLSALIFIWPILVAGASLAINVVLFVGLADIALFIWLGFPPSHWGDAFLGQYAFSIVAFLGFVAIVMRWNAISLQQALRESDQRAHEILQTNEVLLEKSIQQVGLSTQLSTSAVEMSATSRQQASGSAQQASAISEVTSTIEEMGYTARQIAQSAENVAQVAEQTLAAVGRGQSAVDESVAAMEGIKSRVQELADKVLALGEHSQRIGEIMEIINNIADETHLLALNAAIESAGAGEHGRRFTVVAAEVKNLANRAMDSSKEVRGIIAEIQRATNASVMAAEEGLKETERGVGQVYQAGRSMEEIVLLSQRTSEAAQEISLATTQQRTASEQIVETMREIAEVANQTAESSRQLADAAVTLTAIADQLQSAGQLSIPEK
jgi:methyl-accepting chemotaxis protein